MTNFASLFSSPSTSSSDVDYYIKQLLDASFSLVLSSPHDRVRSRALACLTRARISAVGNQLHGVFNEFMRKLKARLSAEGVAEFWDLLAKEAAEKDNLGNKILTMNTSA